MWSVLPFPQVLITLPTELEVLLTSPSTEAWVRRIKYVVFDEVHCIGDSSEGAVWERLLTMLQAPFVALSATGTSHGGGCVQLQLCVWRWGVSESVAAALDHAAVALDGSNGSRV